MKKYNLINKFADLEGQEVVLTDLIDEVPEFNDKFPKVGKLINFGPIGVITEMQGNTIRTLSVVDGKVVKLALSKKYDGIVGYADAEQKKSYKEDDFEE